ncbi:MAG TPA: PTS sugar transporter subunit IIA [Nocardioidaceae bacterium]|nr:PTS sugar transporter subunit IIA [Nocardioidaceae bacterium]
MSPETGTSTGVLGADAVRLGLTATDKLDALRQCGAVLVEIGAATQEYAEAILERERSVSTYMGEGVAIPHGTDESREHIKRAALAFLQFPDGVDWNGKDCRVCIAIASKSDEHIGILQSLAMVLSDSDKAARLRETADVNEVLELLTPEDEEEDA